MSHSRNKLHFIDYYEVNDEIFSIQTSHLDAVQILKGLSGKLIIQLRYASNRPEYFTLEYLKLKKSLNSKIHFNFSGMLYSVPKDASGIPILVSIATELDDAL